MDDATRAGGQWAEVAQAAELVGEADPVAVWGQLVRLATRHDRSLGDLVGRYIRAVDRVRVDIVPTAGVAGDSIRNPAALACYWMRRELAEGEPSIAAPVEVDDLGGEEPAAPPVPPAYVPEPEPARRLTAEERRAIRGRVEAERQAGVETVSAPGAASVGRFAALLARARSERQTGPRAGSSG